MPTYTSSLGLTLPANGDTGWGSTVNNGVTSLVDSAIAGYASVAITAGNAITLTATNGAADTPRNMMLNITGTLTATGTVTIPARSKLYFIRNNTTGGFAITVTTGSGTTVSIPNGRSMVLLCDGTNVREAVDFTTTVNTTNLVYTGTLTGGTSIVNLGSGQFYKDASGNVGIGTTSPAAKLHVDSASILSGLLRNSNAASYTSVRLYNDQNSAARGLEIDYAGSTYASALLTGGPTGESAAITTTGAYPLVLGTNATARMVLDSSGNQINTPSNTPPTLTVNGQMNLTPTSDTNMRISYRGSDGVTRVGNITLA